MHGVPDWVMETAPRYDEAEIASEVPEHMACIDAVVKITAAVLAEAEVEVKVVTGILVRT